MTVSTQLASEPLSSAAQVALPDAPSAAVPADLRAFVRRERLARPDTATTLRHGAVVLAAWVALVALGVAADSLAVWIPIWIALAVCTATPLALMHEAVHHNLFRSRFANHAVGTVAAMWLFFHGAAYRAWHLTHHAYTFTEDDSEQLPERFPSRIAYLGYCFVLGPSFAVILWYGAIATLLGKPPRWVRGPRLARHVRRGALVSFVVAAVVIAAALRWPEVVVKGWLVPAVLGSLFVFPFLTMPEHYEGRGHDQLLDNTRTTKSNAVMRYLYWNNNYHTAHHLLPTVPPQSLGIVDEQIEGRNTLRDRGFFAFHRRVLRDLPWLFARGDAADDKAAKANDAHKSAVTAAPSAAATGPDARAATATNDVHEARNAKSGEITIENRIDPALIPELWRIYRDSFEPLREVALLDHFYTQDVFEALIRDERVFNVIGWRDGRPIGLSAVTNALEVVPQISPPFLHRRFPEHAARNAIYFAVFVCVDPSVSSNTMFARLIAGMGQVAAMREGITVCDISHANCDKGVRDMIAKVVGWFPESSFDEIDAQHYFAATFRQPLDRLPFSKSPMPRPVVDLRETTRAEPATAGAEDAQTEPRQTR